MIDFESFAHAIRDRDFSAFADRLAAIDDVADLAIANDVRYANWYSGLGATLLQLTSFVQPDFAEAVLDRGAELDLHSACALGNMDAIERLLAAKPSSIDTKVDSYLPIQFALRHPQALRMLLEHGDDSNRSIRKLAWFEWEDQAAERDLSQWRPLHMVALGRGDEPHIDSAEVLREFGADLGVTSSPFGTAPIHLAATYDRTHLIRWFVENGCDVDTPTTDTGYAAATANLFDDTPFSPFYTSKQTPLMVALGEGHSAAIKLLLDLGANVNAADSASFYTAPLCECSVLERGPNSGGNARQTRCKRQRGGRERSATDRLGRAKRIRRDSGLAFALLTNSHVIQAELTGQKRTECWLT